MTASRAGAGTGAPHDATRTMGWDPMTDDFFQDGPRLGDQYEDDALLRSFLRWRLPPDVHAAVEPGLRRLGARAATDILALGDAAEAEPPRHVPYDAPGRAR